MTEYEHEKAIQYHLDAIDALHDASELAEGFEWSDGGKA